VRLTPFYSYGRLTRISPWEDFDCPSDDLTCLRAIPWSELALNDGLYGNAGRSQLLGDLLTVRKFFYFFKKTTIP